MAFTDRLSNGWKLTNSSFSILKENKQLIVFPIITGISLLLVLGTFVVGLFAVKGWDFEGIAVEKSDTNYYLFVFAYYVVNYFVIVFFNVALIHCMRLYFRGKKPTLSKGIKFSLSRVGTIFSWAVLAATVGTILKIIQDRSGLAGKIIAGLIGIAWGISTFFVLPVIAYEEIGPIEAIQRSARFMKQNWGETLVASFSFGAIQFIALLGAVLPLWLIGTYISIPAAVVLGLIYLLTVLAVMGTLRTIFIASVYETITNGPVYEFESIGMDSLFTNKK